MDEKVYTPEVVADTPFPGQSTESVSLATSPQKGSYAPTTTPAKSFPTRKIATELISSALSTRSKKVLGEFQLEQSGGFKVGNYKDGVSGEVALTPAGFVAKNKAGLNTIVIDGDTGDAIFRGVLQTGTLVSGLIDVGDNSIVIDGIAKRMVFYGEGGIPQIVIGNA